MCLAAGPRVWALDAFLIFGSFERPESRAAKRVLSTKPSLFRDEDMASEERLRSETRTALINSLAVAFSTLSLASVLARLYTRTRILRIFGPDDITILISQVLAIAVSVTTILEAVWGLGIHIQFVSHEALIRQLKVGKPLGPPRPCLVPSLTMTQCLYANIIIYNAAQICTKISFLIQYRRLFPSDTIQIICFWLLILIGTWGIAQEYGYLLISSSRLSIDVSFSAQHPLRLLNDAPSNELLTKNPDSL